MVFFLDGDRIQDNLAAEFKGIVTNVILIANAIPENAKEIQIFSVALEVSKKAILSPTRCV